MDLDYDIKFSSGKNYVLIVDTRSYAGNFEREMAAYIIGAHDEDRYHGDAESEVFAEAEAEDPRLTVMREKVTTQTHDEYGDVCNTIWPTPGRLNNGYGGHRDAKEGDTGHPAYESVAVFLEEPLTEEELQIVRQRAEEYAKAPTGVGNSDPIKIVDVRQIEVTVAVSTSVTINKV